MKKFLLVVFFAAATAFGIWFGMHGGSSKTSSAAVTALLPKETLAFFHVPDVNGTRAKFHQTDIYKLWQEPAMQEFLQKPLSKAPNTSATREQLQQIEPLEMKDLFFAITGWESQQVRMVGGFRFKGSADDAEKVIGQWRARLRQNAPAATHETMEYQTHRIEIAREGTIAIATVYDGDWFFAGNDLDSLKALLDRADRRVTDAGGTLAAEEEFAAGSKHLPGIYVARAYARLDRYFEKLTQTQPQANSASEQLSILRRLRSISAATTIENGKIRDVFFVGTPKLGETGELTRASLVLASRDTFLYLASFLNLPKELPGGQAATNGFPAAMQHWLGALAASGITAEMWNSAFGSELGIIGDWPESSRIPFLFATLPVKDAAKANELLSAMTAAANEGSAWAQTEKAGVKYYAQPPISPMLPVAPTLALSKDRLVVGHDLPAVEAIMTRSSSDLAASDIFKSAERMVPPATQSFTYIDTALFYTRLDAAVRPMLVMAATFLPSIADTVELGKLPAPEVITRHLSPIVTSQSYQNDGYVTESVGPVSLFHAAAGVVAATGAGATFYGDQLRGFNSPVAVPNRAMTPASATPSPTPR